MVSLKVQYTSQVASLQEEVQSYKAQLEVAATKEHGARESELSYKKQLEELRTRLAEAERDLMESSSETISHETQHRSEVSSWNKVKFIFWYLSPKHYID